MQHWWVEVELEQMNSISHSSSHKSYCVTYSTGQVAYFYGVYLLYGAYCSFIEKRSPDDST